MKKKEKLLSLFIASVYLSAILFQNVAYGTEILPSPEGVESLPAGTLEDSTPPEFISMNLPVEYYFLEEGSLELSVDILETESGFQSGTAEFVNTSGGSFTVDLYRFEGTIRGSFSLPRSSAAAEYVLHEVHLTDAAGNTGNFLNEATEHTSSDGKLMDFSSYTFSSRIRSLTDFSIIQDKTIYEPFDDLNISVSIMDMVMYVPARLELVHEGPDGRYYILEGYLDGNGNFNAYNQIHPSTLSGSYRLVSMELSNAEKVYRVTHHESNTGEGYADLSAGNYEVTGTIDDVNGPDFQGIQINRTSFGPEETLQLTILAEDPGAGIESGQAVFYHPDTDKSISVPLNRISDNAMSGTALIRSTTQSGLWILKELMLYDRAWNGTRLYNETLTGEREGIPEDFSAASFRVSGTITDLEAPEYYSSRLADDELLSFEEFKITIEASDYLSGIREFAVNYRSVTTGKEFFVMGRPDESGELSIVGAVSEPLDQDMEALSLIVWDLEGNSFALLRQGTEQVEEYTAQEYGNLSHLDFHVTYFVTEDVAGYVDDLRADNYDPSDPDITLDLIPGYRAEGLLRATLYYEYGAGSIASIEISRQDMEDGSTQFTGKLEESDPHYMENEEYRLLYLVMEMEDGELVTLHTPYYPQSPRILRHLDADFRISEKPEYPGVLSFNLENKTIDGDGSIIMNLVTDPLGPTVTGYGIVFIVDGERYLDLYKVEDMDNQVFYSTPGSLSGVYEVELLEVYGPNGETLHIFNQKYYPDMPGALDLSQETFTVSGTLGDRTPPEIHVDTLIREYATLTEGMTQRFTLEAFDELSGISHGVLFLESPSGEILFNLPVYLMPDPSDGLLKGELTVSQFMVAGAYRISLLQVYDNSNNLTGIANLYGTQKIISGVTYADFSPHDFTVVDTLSDKTPPVFNGLTKEIESELPYNVRNFIIHASDEDTGLKNIRLVYLVNGVERSVSSNISTVEGVYYGTFIYDPSYTGTWKLRRIELTDQVGNRTVVFHGLEGGTGNMMDLSAGDYVPGEPDAEPVLQSIGLDRSLAGPGESIQVSATVLHGLKLAPEYLKAVFWSETHGLRKSVKLHLQADGEYLGNIAISPYEPDSLWVLESLEITDRYGRSTGVTEESLTGDLKDQWGRTGYNVEGTNPDLMAPNLEDINVSKLEETLRRSLFFSMNTLQLSLPTSQSFTSQNLIRFTVEATDDVSGVKSMKLRYQILDQIVDIDAMLSSNGSGGYTGDFRILPYHPSGDWKLLSIELSDEAGHMRILNRNTETGLVPGYSKLNFKVTGTIPDRLPPVIGDMSISEKRGALGDSIVYTVSVADDASGVKEVNLSLSASKLGGSKNITLKEMADGTYEGEILLTPDMPQGIWRVEYIQATDLVGNTALVTNALMGSSTLETRRDLTGAEFHLLKEERISITRLPKIEYALGEELDLTNLEVQVTYSDGSARILDPLKDLIAFTSLNSTITGIQEIKVNYKSLEASFQVTVTHVEPELLSLKLISLPKTQYYLGEELSLSGLSVSGLYSGNLELPLEILLENITGFDGDTVGEQLLTVTYQGKTVTFKVTVKENRLLEIRIRKTPDKLIYLLDEELDLTGLVVEGIFEKEPEILDHKMLLVKGFDSSKKDDAQVVEVSYMDMEAVFTVKIISLSGVKKEISELEDTLDKRSAQELKKVIDTLEVNKENRSIIEDFYAVWQEILENEKVKAGTDVDSQISLVFSKETLRALDIPEVLQEDVISVNLTLQFKEVPEELLEEYRKQLGKKESLLVVYDLALLKIIERADQSQSTEVVSNEEISGMITIRMAVPEDYQGQKNLIVLYLDDQGVIQELKTEERTVEGTRYLYFETDHFSMYGIGSSLDKSVGTEEVVLEETTDEGTEPEKVEGSGQELITDESLPKSGETGGSPWYALGALLLLTGSSLLRRGASRKSEYLG